MKRKDTSKSNNNDTKRQYPYRNTETGEIRYMTEINSISLNALAYLSAKLLSSSPFEQKYDLWKEIEETEAVRTLYGPKK